jgi:undecaprenyl diphosphate synthase
MDGNNRWAKKKSLNKFNAYKKGSEKLIKLSTFIFNKYGVENISAFALSSNNLKRSNYIINTIKKVLHTSLSELENHKINFNIRIIGNFNFLDKETINKILKINNNSLFNKNLYIFLNYGGRDDIHQASRKMKKSDHFPDNLLTKSIPDPDILIRSGGHSRLSNFMLYQLSFTELFFIKKLWPDITNKDIVKIIEKYHLIDRKFGK